jgi:hypothetical protein
MVLRHILEVEAEELREGECLEAKIKQISL